ncbi:MAG TPA: hypothetical protein VLI05_04595 [Candidatus Saccharimonadia bacterium]|nr:hypothetical protein [Candidatus Saccharimonadia bacterium]
MSLDYLEHLVKRTIAAGKPWGVGPTRAWLEVLNDQLIVQEALWRDGQRVERIEPPGERSWVLGRYVL